MDRNPQGSSVRGILGLTGNKVRILQARLLQWVAVPFSRGPSRPRDQTRRQILYPLSHQESPILFNFPSGCYTSVTLPELFTVFLPGAGDSEEEEKAGCLSLLLLLTIEDKEIILSNCLLDLTAKVIGHYYYLVL